MKTAVICLAYLVAIAAAELITILVSPLGGIIFYLVILSLLILNSSIVGQHPSQRLFLALGLAPLMRILSLSVTLAELSQIYWYLVISAPLLVGIFAVITALNLHPPEIGLTRGTFSIQVLIALTGIGFGLVEYLILKPEPLIDHLTGQEFLAPALVILVCTGFVEELAFRGVMQRSAMDALGSWGWVYIAVLFSLFQIWHRSAIHCLFVLPVALFFGWIVKRTGSILGVSLSHGLVNICLYLIFPFVFKLSG